VCEILNVIVVASRKSNPSSIPQGYIEIHTLGHTGGRNSCGGDTVEVYYDKRWHMGLWSTQEEAEGMLKPAFKAVL
jgi:hypothetical protein